jgi:hypothetical protein
MMRLAVFLALSSFAPIACAQSFNVDLNMSGPVEIGGGVPSDEFGGALNQTGRWNSLSPLGHANWLYDLGGVQRNVGISIADSTGGNLTGIGFANLSNTGDIARLLNDVAVVDGDWRSWTFHGLVNGEYRVATYAVRPDPTFVEARVSVNGSPIAISTGPPPGNQLIQGITHVVQTTNVTDGTLTIHVSRPHLGEAAAVNGFQISAVPEPGTLVFSSLAVIGWIGRRRSASRQAQRVSRASAR